MPSIYAGMNAWAGAGIGEPKQNAGAPGNGTSEVQTVTIDATGGTFKLAFDNYTTAAISWSATNNTLFANVTAALVALPNVGAAGVVTAVATMTAGVGTMTVTFGGNLAKKDVPLMTVADNSLTGTATLSVATTTPGVDATHRRAPTGALVQDVTNGVLYINTSATSLQPTWVKVGTQS